MNKDFFVNGEKFISARRAAKEVGYAEDYVGQLCRDGKLPARMVGRSWYVSRKAILNHKKGGAKKTAAPIVVVEQGAATGSKDLFFNGERFISSTKAAKTVGYANDYIGQLCRSGALECKMVGRSWYVSRKSILTHKKGGSKTIAPRKKIIAPRATKISAPEILREVEENIALPEASVFTYKKTSAVVLPALKKETEEIVPTRWRVLSGIVVVFIAVFIVLNSGFSWMAYFAPAASNKVDIKIADASDSMTAAASNAESFASFVVGSVEAKITSIFGSKQAANTDTETASQFSPNGIVAIPENARHADDVAKIQSDFSDPVNVTFDQDGQSGVITPDFQGATTTQNYTFVMVPVAKTK